MAQTIIVILIVFLAALAAGIKLFRFFKSQRSDPGCAPEKCKSCPYNDKNCESRKL